jgi:hypothetical protein
MESIGHNKYCCLCLYVCFDIRYIAAIVNAAVIINALTMLVNY